MLESKLTRFGLSEKESSVYLALLEHGTSTVSEIARKTSINRSTSYVLLGSLSERGLVSLSSRKGAKFFTAVPPERFVYMSEERVRQGHELVALAQALLPQMRLLNGKGGVRPSVQFFEGEEGIRSIYEDTLTSSETIRAYASIDDINEILPGYFPAYFHRRSANGIHIRAIFPDTPEAREFILNDADVSRESCLIPSEGYAFSPEINVYDNKVVFMLLRERFGLMIESAELAQAMKKIFDLSWEEARRLHAVRP